jgi:hypothetical protein
VFDEQLAKARPDIKTLYMSGYTDDAIDNRGTPDPERTSSRNRSG